jgi:hypothetical protein
VRRRNRPAADPEAVEALAVLDHYRAQLEALREAGDPYAPWRLHVLWWARHDIEQWGMDGPVPAAGEGLQAGGCAAHCGLAGSGAPGDVQRPSRGLRLACR